jgi:GMP synthase-like glutamine amidotransferase
MGVYEEDRYPFLRAGLRLIEEALRRDLPVLGVCLGSQLLAAALGARVRPGSHPEVGWLPVELEEAAAEDRLFSGLPRRFVAFHWHGDVFDVPAGATGLARSERTPHQAFRYGDRAYGLLFHLEVDGSHGPGHGGGFPGRPPAGRGGPGRGEFGRGKIPSRASVLRRGRLRTVGGPARMSSPAQAKKPVCS